MKKRTTLLFLILLIITCFSVGCSHQEADNNEEKDQPSNVDQITLNTGNYDLGDDSQIIKDFYTRLYDAQKNAETTDITEFFSDQNEAFLTQTYLDDLIYTRNTRSYAPKIQDYEIDLTVTGVRKEGSTTYIDLTENQIFDFNSIRSESPGILCTIAIQDGKVISYDREEDLFLALRESDDVAAYSSEFLSQVDANSKLLEASYESQGEAQPSSGYDRDLAAEYADTYVLSKNPEFTDYDQYGGNCNNFISQCLKAGGIPEDLDDFGWSPDSPAWIGVDSFYDYAKNNESGGLKADTQANFFTGEPGDIIQVGQLGGFKHSVIITDVIKDKDGKTVDYLIASNSLDRKDFPVSAYGYSDMRLIKVLGSN